MTKSQLVQSVQVKTGLSPQLAEAAVNAALSSISEALSQGERVGLANFGQFSVKERAPRTGRNLNTGETITIPAGKAVCFTPAVALKEAVNK